MKTIFVKNGDKVADRPHPKIAEIFFEGNYGLIFNDNSFWRSQRRFALHVLRDFGLGRPILEQTIADQASAVCEYFRNLNEKPIDLTKILTVGSPGYHYFDNSLQIYRPQLEILFTN